MPNPDVQKIGKYEIQAELGQGGFGRVYRAFDPTVGRPVALKILMAEGNQDLLTRFRNEATSAGNLRHRNIVTIYDFGEFNGRPYLVMELLEGEDLTQVISSAKPLSLLQKMSIMDQVAEGLDCAHSNGVVHRDVKPANIRILPDGTVKILDFGIARASRDQRTRLTQQGDLIGTILYVSPEQFGGADADALCDIFAYGVTYYEFLAGKHPFASGDPRSVMFKIAMEDPPSLRSFLPECPESLEHILNRALHKDRELRYQTLRDLRLDTEPLIIDLKQQRAKEIIAEVQELSSQEPQPQALTLISEALNLDPGNKEARHLREVVQRGLQKKALQPRVDGMLQSAQEQLSKGAVSQAVQTLESAHKLDQTDARINGLLETAREKLKIVKEAVRLATAATAHVSRGEWPAALEKASEAAKLDSTNREAARALDAIQKYQAALNAKIEAQVESGDLDAAISGLQNLAALRPDSAEIQERLADVVANKAERDRVQSVLEDARHLIANHQFTEAIAALSSLPDTPAVSASRQRAESGLAARKRADAIAKSAESARALLSSARIDEALQELESSLRQYPDEATLVELRRAAKQAKAAHEREVLIQSVTSDAGRLAAENRFGDALETVRGGLQKLPADQTLLALREQYQTRKDQHDRANAIREAAGEGRRLLEQDPAKALEHLRKASALYPEDGGLKQLTAEAEESLRSRQRREAVSKAVEEAGQRLGRGDYEGALGVLGTALQSSPDDARLLDLRRKALDAQAIEERRRRAVNQAAEECERLIQSGDFPEALRVVEQALRESSNDPVLLETQQRARAEQEKQADAVRGALIRASEFESKSDFTAALAEIDEALSRYPKEKSLAEKRAALAAAQAEFVRKRDRQAALDRVRGLTVRSHADLPDQEIDGVLQEAQELARIHSNDPEIYRIAVDAGQHLIDLRQARRKVAAGDLDAARALCGTYLKQFPKHAGFLSLENQILERERQIAMDYKRDVEKLLHESTEVSRRVQVLEEAVRRYPDEPYFKKELDLLNSARAIADQANSSEKAGQLAEAAKLWQSLGTTYPAYPDLQAHLDRVSGILQQERQKAKQAWTDQIHKLLSEDNFAPALELIAKVEIEFPGEFSQLAAQAKQGADRRAQAQRFLSEAKELMRKARWADGQEKLLAALESAPDDHEIAKQAIDAHAKYARATLNAGDWKAADALLQQASALNPGYKAPADLRSGIDERKQIEFVDQVLNESQRLEQAGKLQAALDTIVEAQKTYPTESRLRERKAGLEKSVLDAARREERVRVLNELRRLESESRKAAGLEDLQRIHQRAQLSASGYPNDADFAGPFESISSQFELLRRGRKLLEDRKFDEAEKSAGEALARFPNHPAFAALKQSIQQAREQAASAYRAQIAANLTKEPNLDRREAILTEALKRYPAEPSFQRELESVLEKKRVLASALKDARDAEKAGRYEEAVAQWEKLRSLDAAYPNVDTEIQRLRALLAKARAAAMDAELTLVRAAIDLGNLPQADSLMRRVETDFGAGANEECARLRVRLNGLIEATRLAEEGRGLFAKSDFAGGSARLVQSARKIPQEASFVQGLLGELFQKAESLLESDWRAADPVLQALADLKPDSDKLPALRVRVEEKRREEFIHQALRESQQFRSAGDLASAEKSIQKALAQYPNDARLAEQITAIRSALAEQTRIARRDQAIVDLTAIAKEAETANVKRLRKLPPQIDTILARAPSEAEVQARAAEIRTIVANRISELEAPRQKVSPAVPPPAPPVAETPAVAAPPKRNLVMIGTAAAVVIVGIIGIVRWTGSDRQGSVTVTSDVAGASVTVGNQTCVTPSCVLKLAPGTHTLTAKKDGFKTVTQQITLAPRQAELRVPLALESLPQILQVNTNFETGRVLLDGNAAGNLRDGQFSITSGLSPGQHTIRVTGGGADFQTTWRSAVGARPELVGQMEAKDVQATVIANAGSTAAIACNCGVQAVTVDDAPSGQTQASDGASTPLQNLAEGSRRVSIAGHSMILNIRQNPTLNVFLSLDRNVGTIVVETGEDNARVYLNNRVYRRTTQGGSIRIPVDVGEYSVRVEKDGFQKPPAQTVSVKKGDEARIVTTLTAVAPVMEIAGAVPGAQVKLDGRAVGEIGSDGSFRAEVPAGEHVVELSKDDYNPARVTTQFSAGKTAHLNPAQLAMAKVVKAPPPPDPKQIDAQDWERVHNSNNIDSIENYVRQHPDGAHVEEARNTVTRLRQDAQVNAARQADQSAWDAADKSTKAALQGYLSRFPNGAHAQETRGLIAGFEGKEAEAQAAAQRAKEARDKEVEQANRLAADQQSIARFFATYSQAYTRMDLSAIEAMWSSMPRNVAEITSRQFRDARSLTFQMTPVGQAVVNGDSAVVTCTRTLSMVPRSGQRPPSISERIRVTLKRAGGNWAISSIEGG